MASYVPTRSSGMRETVWSLVASRRRFWVVSTLPFPDPALDDGVVALRPWRVEDTAQKLAAFSDPLCQRFSWSRETDYAEADARAHFEGLEPARLAGVELNLAVVNAAGADEVWGGASIYQVDLEDGRAAVGYWVAPQARGRGIATRTLRLLATWAFEDLAVLRLELTCAPDNLASQRVAQRCGFVREGVLRSHIRFKSGRRDTVVFSLLPGELR
jgi:RimJ/RimL family protein N-acetyltransferase